MLDTIPLQLTSSLTINHSVRAGGLNETSRVIDVKGKGKMQVDSDGGEELESIPPTEPPSDRESNRMEEDSDRDEPAERLMDTPIFFDPDQSEDSMERQTQGTTEEEFDRPATTDEGTQQQSPVFPSGLTHRAPLAITIGKSTLNPVSTETSSGSPKATPKPSVSSSSTGSSTIQPKVSIPFSTKTQLQSSVPTSAIKSKPVMKHHSKTTRLSTVPGYLPQHIQKLQLSQKTSSQPGAALENPTKMVTDPSTKPEKQRKSDNSLPSSSSSKSFVKPMNHRNTD